MSKALGVFILLATFAFGAEDPWTKVRDLKTGTELRVYKVGAAQPILAKSVDVTDENLVVLVRNEQLAIPKAQVDHVDYRPAASRVKTEGKSTVNDPDTTPGPPGHGSRTPTTSSSSSLSVGSKPDFETIYRRLSPGPKK